MAEISEEDRKRVENGFRSRIKALNLKYDTKKYHEAQIEYFIGAMIALNVQDYLPWTLPIATGRCILKKEDHDNSN